MDSFLSGFFAAPFLSFLLLCVCVSVCVCFLPLPTKHAKVLWIFVQSFLEILIIGAKHMQPRTYSWNELLDDRWGILHGGRKLWQFLLNPSVSIRPLTMFNLTSRYSASFPWVTTHLISGGCRFCRCCSKAETYSAFGRWVYDGSFLADEDCWEGCWSILACSLVAVETDSWCAPPTALWTDEGLGWGW